MQVRELAVPGAWEFTAPVFPDARGAFTAPFQAPAFEAATGHPLRLAQASSSTSRRGVVRGVHVRDVPPGQAKYVWCPRGALLDVVVDVRVGSPTFGRWDAGGGGGPPHRAVYLAEGLGHAFVALADDTVASYLCSTGYAPEGERTVSPLDPALGLPWLDRPDLAPSDLAPSDLVLSDRDRDAPTLAEAAGAGLLPRWADCRRLVEELRSAPR